jgi:hypothetical protein
MLLCAIGVLEINDGPMSQPSADFEGAISVAEKSLRLLGLLW